MLCEPDGHQVARLLQAGTHRDRPERVARIVLRPPHPESGTLVELDRRVQDHRRRREARFERGEIDERLERRAGLAARLGGTVELAAMRAAAADERPDAPGLRVPGLDAADDGRALP